MKDNNSVQLELFPMVSCSSEEIRKKRGKVFCRFCKKNVTVFSVPAFPKHYSQVLFCEECNQIHHKPEKFGLNASTGMGVKVYLENGDIVDSVSAYHPQKYGKPLKLTHKCYIGKDVELIEYVEKLNHNFDDEFVNEYVSHCPGCDQEKRMKYFIKK